MVDNSGIKAINSTMNSMKNIKGHAFAAIFSVDSPVIPETTNKFKPNGGVIKPIPSDVIIIMQNCISFMPIASATGFRRGARMTIFGVVSMTQPAAIKMPIIKSVRR